MGSRSRGDCALLPSRAAAVRVDLPRVRARRGRLSRLPPRGGLRVLVGRATARPARVLADEALRRPAASSQIRTVAALKGFFRFCLESEWLERDPALVLRTPKKREALPDVLDRAELKRLMRAPDLAGGTASTTASASATGSCSPSSPTPASAGPSCSASIGTTSTCTAASCASATPRAAANASSPSTPPSARLSPTTSASASRSSNRRSSSASRAGDFPRRSSASCSAATSTRRA